MNKTWILIANRSQARLFHTENWGQEIAAVQEFSHPEGHKKGVELETDRPGRSFDSAGPGRHATGPEHDVHDQERLRFAKELAEFLELARKQRRFDRLGLAAAPQFLGALRGYFSIELKERVYIEIAKDFPQSFSGLELISALQKDFFSGVKPLQSKLL